MAAESMDISVYLLKLWLAGTEYEKFNNWIQHLRIEKAKQILAENPNIPGSELAKRCGFCDRQYLQRTFMKIEGKTQTEWLSEIKKDCQN